MSEQQGEKPKEKVVPAKEAELIVCSVCGEKWGHFEEDPFTHAYVHVQCKGGFIVEDRRYKPGGFRA
jgi:hypothetical protein